MSLRARSRSRSWAIIGKSGWRKRGFFFPLTKSAHMKMNLRNMWTRFAMTRAEVQTFHGMLRQLLRGKG